MSSAGVQVKVVCMFVCGCLCVYLFEVSILALLPVHHVVEDGNHDVPDLHLRDQCHSQKRANHSGDEVDLVLTYGGEHVSSHYQSINR